MRYHFDRPGHGALALLFLVLFWAFASPAEAKKLKIVTTIAQIGEPVSVITGGAAEVESLLGEGVDPHLYRPTRTDIVKLTRADVILYNGLALEAQLAEPIKQLARTKAVLALGETLEKERLLAYDGSPGDPHIWMDPALWRLALNATVDLLAERDPENADLFRRNANAYFKRLDALGGFAERIVATIPEKARVVVTAHDAFNYFGKRFGLEVLGVQGLSTESEAGLKAIETMVDLIVERKVPAVFVESSVSDRNMRALIDGARARGHVVALGGILYSDAMGPPGTYEGTYVGMIDHNVTTIVRGLGGTVPPRGMAGRLKAPGTE